MNVTISNDRTYLTVELKNHTSRFHAVWLRDNALDPQTVSRDNGQRLITLLEQPKEITISSANMANENNIQVVFSDTDKVFDFPLDYLESNRYDREFPSKKGWSYSWINRWDADLQNRIPTVEYQEAKNQRDKLGGWLTAVRNYGFAIMTGLPDNPESLLDVVSLFGFVRQTNYGNYFDVRSEVDPVNLAYTSLGLQAHTDNPYRDPAPTLQILSCIENTADGGESIVIDGFNAAELLDKENPRHFELLTRYSARFRYAGSEGIDLQSRKPIIELSPDGELTAIHFNNRSAAPFRDIPFESMQEFYAAYRHFAEILERKRNAVSFKLKPNQLFIVDNTRVLHSRNAFTGTGTRWLRGCYPDRDGLLSTLAVIESESGMADGYD